MFISKNYNLSKKQVNFGYRCYLDIGSSDPTKGTIKLVIREGNEILHRLSGKLCPDGIESSKHFVEQIISVIKACKEKCIDKINLLPKLKQACEEIIIFTTGRPYPTEKGTYFLKRFSTLSTHTNEELKNIDYSPIQEKFKDTKITILNDMIGAAGAVLKRIKYKKIPNSGLVITTGGGFGTSYFKKVTKNGIPYIKISESRDGNREINGHRMEKYAASVRALIRNFCKEFGFAQSTIAKYEHAGDARLITSEDPDFLNEIIKNPQYSINFVNEASKETIDKYAEALAHCIKLKTVDDGEKLDKVFLSGKIIAAIDRFINGNPQLWKRNNFSLEELINKYLKAETKKTRSNIKINIISDIKDNTEGGLFMQNKDIKIIKEQERGLPIVSVLVPQ